MAISGTNNWGSYTANDGSGAEYPAYPVPEGTATPPATGNLVPAQSPSGSVTGEASTFNFANDITSTEQELKNVLEVQSAQQGTAALAGTVAGTVVTLAGVAGTAIQTNAWNTGAVGSTGNKFS